MNSLEERLIVITRDGPMVGTITLRPCALPESMVATHLLCNPVPIPLANDMSLSISEGSLCVAKTVPHLDIRANWLPTSSGSVVMNAEFHGDITARWTPPDGMRLIIAASFSRRRANTPNNNMSKGYLIAQHTSLQCYALPLPNLFADCEVCTGADLERIGPIHLTHACDLVYEMINKNPWGRDVQPEIAANKALFTMNKDGQWERPENWTAHCQPSNSVVWMTAVSCLGWS